MNSIVLHTAFVISIAIGSSIVCANKVAWAYSREGKYNNHDSDGHAIQTKEDTKGKKAEAVIDPVCGMIVSDIKKALSEEYKGKVYYFCSENCRKTFKKSPKSFVEGLLKR